MKMAKKTWMKGQCQEVEAYLNKHNSKKAYKLVNMLTEKQCKFRTIQDNSWKCLIEEHEILNKWTEYSSDHYNFEADWDPVVFECPQIPDEEHHSILRQEM